MSNSSREREQRVVTTLLACAASSMSEANQNERLAHVLNTVLSTVGSAVRVSLTAPADPTERLLGDVLRDTNSDTTVTVHLQEPDAVTWFSFSDLFQGNDVLRNSGPYELKRQLFLPIALIATNLRDGLFEALGSDVIDSTIADRGRELESMLLVQRDKLLSAHPLLKEKHVDPDAKQAWGLFEYTALPQDWLKRIESRKKGVVPENAHSARVLARLSSSTPAAHIHAELHVKNSMRMHHVLAVQNVVAQGLRTLRDVDDVSDQAYFRALYDKSSQRVYELYLIDRMRREEQCEGDEHEKRLADAALSTWIARTSPTRDDDTASAQEQLLRQEMNEAEAFVRKDRDAGWQHVASGGDRNAIGAFLAASDFLKNPPEEVPRTLRDVIDTNRCRDELMAAHRLHYADHVGAKQYEIAARVLAAVLRFPHSHVRQGQAERDVDPDHCQPTYVRDKKRVNCFTGPWLAAALLLECGFKEENIFYCDVQGRSGSTFGTHGSLLLALDSGQQVLLDVSYHKLRNVPLRVYLPGTEKKLRNLIKTEENSEYNLRTSPVLATLSGSDADRTSIHPRMAIMPMRQGFAWGTLLTTGMDAFEAGTIQEARYAFELAHSLHPSSPDILIGLARCFLAEGNRHAATILLDDAIKRCPGHLMAHYQRALFYIEEKQYARARESLDIVLDERVTWWGGKEFVDHARALSASLNDILHLETSVLLANCGGQFTNDICINFKE